MAIVVNTNVPALGAAKDLNNATSALNKSLQRMSSGYKINSAKDDAAGAYIATNMETQIRGSKVAQNNVATGANVLQIAEGNLNVLESNLQRIRDLAVQAANAVYSTDSMNAMKAEVTERASEITRIATAAEFNGLKLFDGSTGALGDKGLRLQVAANSKKEDNSVTIASSVFGYASAGTLGLTTSSITTAFSSAAGAAAFIATVDTALANLNNRKSTIGAYQNKLESAMQNLVINVENTTAARSTIMDADIAEESINFSKSQILQQTTASMLAQANAMPQLALKLIG